MTRHAQKTFQGLASYRLYSKCSKQTEVWFLECTGEILDIRLLTWWQQLQAGAMPILRWLQASGFGIKPRR